MNQFRRPEVKYNIQTRQRIRTVTSAPGPLPGITKATSALIQLCIDTTSMRYMGSGLWVQSLTSLFDLFRLWCWQFSLHLVVFMLVALPTQTNLICRTGCDTFVPVQSTGLLWMDFGSLITNGLSARLEILNWYQWQSDGEIEHDGLHTRPL